MARLFRFAILLIGLVIPGLAVGVPASGPAAAREVVRYTYQRRHDPNGIGKFYMGREIAKVMGHGAAAWLERPERDRQEQPERLIEALDLRPGDVVADIGAGTGHITSLLARAVGPDGRVKAVDIQPQMLRLLRKRMAAEKVGNVDPVLGRRNDPRLPERAMDLVLLVDVYHEFNYPYEMMQAVVRSLKPGGRVVLVEYRMEDPRVPIKLVHKMSEGQAIAEMKEAGLRHKETIETLPWQHILVFELPRPATQAATRPATQAVTQAAE